MNPPAQVVQLSVPDLVKIVSHMARTGYGTDDCLKAGVLPLAVNCYSPLPDLQDLEERKIYERRSELGGVAFRSDAQAAFLKELGEKFGRECDWPVEKIADEHAFHLDNGCFSYGCAAGTHCMIRHWKPRRVIEIGSGYSSRLIAAALRQNAGEGAPVADYTIVDPFMSPSTGTLPGLTKAVGQPVERLAPAFFDALRAGDVLFVDSGHTVRIGGDVNFLILDVLPRLAPGVVIHFHDISLPREYPKVYYTNPAFRVFWTEAYLLQAFLAFNSEFEVLLALHHLMTDRAEEFRAAFPPYRPDRHWGISSSFWIRRKPGPPGVPRA
ncbi:MAG: class I SAM-dependent methyltransferase [Lentisphaerae bacterium]|nr:class I SAM-dependent methyltransferase [Lentisphaerota bacterium]